ncbi:MAG TPA: cytochrome c oxidase subunit II [Roseiflexaceae bacterium]
MGSVPFFPDQASTVAPQVDAIYFALILLSALFAVPVALLIVYFGVRYRRGSQASRASGSAHGGTLKIELAWTVFPALLALGMFTWAATVYYRIERPPAGAVEVYVVGQQWMWKVQHPEGQREINQLHVPVGRPIKLLMTSQDVIHSFYIAAFRVKQDVLPGRYTTIWFQATQAGDYAINCAEYCGTDHAMMGGTVVVMEPAQYEAWLSGGNTAAGPQSPETMAAAGQQLFTSLGCSGCHRMDGSGPGPSLVGIYGKTVHLQGGATAVADEGYIRNSILLPQSQIVAGYGPIMPSFQGQVSEEQILQLIAYIKSLGSSLPAPASLGQPNTGAPAGPSAVASPSAPAVGPTPGAQAAP